MSDDQQLEHAIKNKKTLFENVNIDWGLAGAEDASTDFSDDDIMDERVCLFFMMMMVMFTHDDQNVGCHKSWPPNHTA